MNEADHQAHYVHVPADSRMPLTCRTLTIPIAPVAPLLDRRIVRPICMKLKSAEGERAWSRCVTAHQHLLFCWIMAAEAYRNVIYMLRRGRWEAADLWLRRASKLLLASTGSAMRARSLTRRVRETFFDLRHVAEPGGLAEEGFNDYRLLAEALKETQWALAALVGPRVVTPSPSAVRLTFEEAVSVWTRSGEDISGLFAPPCIPDDGVPIKGNGELTFGVLRTRMTFIEDYQYSLFNTVGAAKAYLTSELDLEAQSWVEQGDGLMMAMVAERLDPPVYRPDA